MAIEISVANDNPKQLTYALVQVVDMLDLYQAELARILGLQCQDIGQLVNAQRVINPASPQWLTANDLICFYQLLYQYHHGNGVAMRHWLRRLHPEFNQTPHLMLVDEARLSELIDHLRRQTL